MKLTKLKQAVTFTEVEAASRSRKFSIETALPPVRTVTDLFRGVTNPDGCSSPAPPDIAEGGSGVALEVECASPSFRVGRRCA
jgi:hypothetical protein